ncbi:hypothetical protein ASPFODRAFT_680157 [Aspergillus luchuensis CBS 106.47]|uniref:Uncharacterized protein n=1 Tax=Aspergillus luchuensis (strain CBS 106.47) TaxID=1137211 RepID=A0A1M3TCN9_ASPLC|nr:hypothetical protein ASPFODRAFT_680157 [Aspergillus luchuensis CBS 106.47]
MSIPGQPKRRNQRRFTPLCCELPCLGSSQPCAHIMGYSRSTKSRLSELDVSRQTVEVHSKPFKVMIFEFRVARPTALFPRDLPSSGAFRSGIDALSQGVSSMHKLDRDHLPSRPAECSFAHHLSSSSLPLVGVNTSKEGRRHSIPVQTSVSRLDQNCRVCDRGVQIRYCLAEFMKSCRNARSRKPA